MPDIRRATPADLSAIRTCATAAYAPYIATIGKPPAPMVADFAAHVAASELWVMADAETILGFIVFFPRGRAMFLENVAVHPDASGRGFGRQLVSFCEDTARNIGCDSVVLYTNEKMTANLSLYPRLGYCETGRRTEVGFNRVYFEKRL